MTEFSSFGTRFTHDSGILSLMQDLSMALSADGNSIMMGGGNPAHIPELESIFKKRLDTIINDTEEFRRLIGIYDPPQGEHDFRHALAMLLKKEYDWDITADNIVLTNGSQPAFFALFNIFAGRFDNGTSKKILFPLAPEYIGYADLGLSDDFFLACQPKIEYTGEYEFKYRIDFDALTIDETIGAICLSRPTNPTGNVLTDEEMARLDTLAHDHGIPLIVDNAYGAPFPYIMYTEAQPFWNENTIMCMSLSKFGLPAARTGIVVAGSKYITMLSAINAIISLSPNSFGSMIASPMVENGDILRVSREIIQPFYYRKMKKAVDILHRELSGVHYYIHVPEGAMFLWIWLPELSVSSKELYERIKQKGVVILSGHYFFPGITYDWKHTSQCLRITYSQDDSLIEQGFGIIATEIKKALQV